MFKCNECGKIFDIKPSFCDCGNDSFVEIEKPKETVKKSNNLLKQFDLPSVVIFCICIILSILSLIYIKPNEQPENKPVKQKIVRKTADINTFWKDDSVIVKQEPAKPQKIIETPVAKVEVKKVVVPQIKKTQTPVQKTVQKPQPKTVNTQPKQQTQNKPTETINQIKPQPVQKVENPKPVQSLKSYTNGLRNVIFSKIDFTKISGDGYCTVTFKINSNGQLINRKFTVQSPNSTLNDQVYSAIASTPYYNAPPSTYTGQTLRFSVKFQNGQYEVSLY